jgi:hypothetical protein
MIPPELYAKWLNDPITRAVFAEAERLARPQAIMTQLTGEPAASYRLGYVTGTWDMLDQMRSLGEIPTEELTATYEKEKSNGD